MNKNLVAVLLAGAVTVGTVASVSAFGGGMFGRAEMDSEVRDAIEQAMEDGDYDAWVQAHEDAGLDGRFSDLSEADFAKMVEMHEARQNGDFETAQEIAEELGMPTGGRGGRGGKGGCAMGGGMHGGFGQFETYAEWQSAMAEKGLDTSAVSEEDFANMQSLQKQMQTLRQKFQLKKGQA